MGRHWLLGMGREIIVRRMGIGIFICFLRIGLEGRERRNRNKIWKMKELGRLLVILIILGIIG